MSVSVAAKVSCSTVGEGPHWQESLQQLVYVDIQSRDIHRYDPITGLDTKHHLEGTVGMVVPHQAGGYVVGLDRTLAHFDWDSGDVTKVYGEVDQGTRNRFNDGKCDVTGRLWAGTMGYESTAANVERHMASLYSLEIDGRMRTHLRQIDVSNGLAWTDDNSTMFYIDSIPRKVYAFDFDLEKGELSNQKVAVDFGGDDTLATLGLPDGMSIDSEGKLWVACFGAGKVIRFDPQTGQQLQSVEFPATRITSCCFGGKDHTDLYVTCSRYLFSDEELQTQPLAGSLFKVTGLGVKGKPTAEYAGRA